MSSPASLESFERELNRLVAKFEKEFTAVTDPGYSEARLRQDYLDPFTRALGWDLENHAGLVQQQREVEIESRTDVAGRAKRTDGTWINEAVQAILGRVLFIRICEDRDIYTGTRLQSKTGQRACECDDGKKPRQESVHRRYFFPCPAISAKCNN